MCYDVKASLEAQLKRAKHNGDLQSVREIMEKLVPLSDLPLHHATGFSHPKLFIYTDEIPDLPTLAIWGLVPHWVKERAQLKKTWNNTLNARGETIFEKPSFRTSAKEHRCLVFVDGFYEHHHFKGKTYPYYIHQKNNEPMALAGLWSEWADPETGELFNTFSIVTTEGNTMLAKIHNNPKLDGPRMPLILPSELEEDWLAPINDELEEQKIKELIRSYPTEELESYTVGRIRGKEYVGNIPEVSNKKEYPELSSLSLDL